MDVTNQLDPMVPPPAAPRPARRITRTRHAVRIRAAHERTCDDSTFYSAILDRVGFRDDTDTSADGSADNDLAHERTAAVLAFIDQVAPAPWPQGLLPHPDTTPTGEPHTSPVDLPATATRIAHHLRDNGFPAEHAVQRNVLALAEEVGEFVGAYRRWSGQARRTGIAADMHHELADVVITAYVTAHELGMDLDAAIAAKLAVIFRRGWRDTTPDATDGVV